MITIGTKIRLLRQVWNEDPKDGGAYLLPAGAVGIVTGCKACFIPDDIPSARWWAGFLHDGLYEFKAEDEGTAFEVLP